MEQGKREAVDIKGVLIDSDYKVVALRQLIGHLNKAFITTNLTLLAIAI
jgi:hypothetical protein